MKFDISQSQHRRARVSKGSNKMSFAIKLFNLCDMKTQQHYILLKGVKVFQRKLGSSVDSLRGFHIYFDVADRCLQISIPKHKIEVGYTKSNNNVFVQYFRVTLEHPNRQIGWSFRLENHKICVFPIEKKMSYKVISSYLQNCQPLFLWNSTLLQKPISPSKQLWIIREPTVTESFISYTFSLEWSSMIFSLSIDANEGSLDLGRHSDVLTVDDFV